MNTFFIISLTILIIYLVVTPIFPVWGRWIVACGGVMLSIVKLRLHSFASYPIPSKGIVLVTGSSTGIGRYVAIELACEGYSVFAGVRNPKDALELEQVDVKGTGQIKSVILDVSQDKDIRSVTRLLQDEHDQGHPLVGLINNAGIADCALGPFELQQMSDIRRMFDVNVFGMMACCQAFIPLLRESKGRIINISSIAGMQAAPGNVMYASGKFAVEAFSDGLRQELKQFGISVSVMQPGHIESAIWTKCRQINMSERWTEAQTKLYPWLPRFFRRLAKGSPGASPAVVMVDILHALQSSHPHTRYSQGPGSGIVTVLKALPDRSRDKIMLTRYAKV